MAHCWHITRATKPLSDSPPATEGVAALYKCTTVQLLYGVCWPGSEGACILRQTAPAQKNTTHRPALTVQQASEGGGCSCLIAFITETARVWELNVVADVKHSPAGTITNVPKADVMHMFHRSCIVNASNLPRLLLHNYSSQLDLVFPSWGFCVLDHLQEAMAAYVLAQNLSVALGNKHGRLAEPFQKGPSWALTPASSTTSSTTWGSPVST